MILFISKFCASSSVESSDFMNSCCILMTCCACMCCEVEFPAVLLNTRSGEIEAEFHRYVQPQENPILSDFCKQLTGISQVWCLLLFITIGLWIVCCPSAIESVKESHSKGSI